MAAEQPRPGPVPEEVKYYPWVAPTRSAAAFLEPFVLNQLKSHLTLDVQKQSRLFTEE